MRTLTALALSSALVGIMATGAYAQSTTAPAGPPQRSADCHPGLGPNSPTVGSGDRTLSDKLADSKGVICPPASPDREMAVPPPPTGSNMPVIPPTAAPGNTQGPQTK